MDAETRELVESLRNLLGAELTPQRREIIEKAADTIDRLWSGAHAADREAATDRAVTSYRRDELYREQCRLGRIATIAAELAADDGYGDKDIAESAVAIERAIREAVEGEQGDE